MGLLRLRLYFYGHMGNEFDDLSNNQIVKLDLNQKLYQRYADDKNVAQRSIGKRHKFCPLTGSMIEKPTEQIVAEADIEEDELTLRELKNVADSHIDFLETFKDRTDTLTERLSS